MPWVLVLMRSKGRMWWFKNMYFEIFPKTAPAISLKICFIITLVNTYIYKCYSYERALKKVSHKCIIIIIINAQVLVRTMNGWTDRLDIYRDGEGWLYIGRRMKDK